LVFIGTPCYEISDSIQQQNIQAFSNNGKPQIVSFYVKNECRMIKKIEEE